MAAIPQQTTRESAAAVLHGVSYKEYARLVKLDANRHLRMAYHDGTLEIMSPNIQEHEKPSRRISLVVTTVAVARGVMYEATGSGTYHRAGDGPRKGAGREADQSFYFQNVDRFPMDRDPDLDAGDPPPDLWVEVDNRASSRAKLPTYARLGVPEVWQYRSPSRQLRFFRLIGQAYEPIDRSLALDVLTPGLVLEALAAGIGLREGAWLPWLNRWAEQFPPGRP